MIKHSDIEEQINKAYDKLGFKPRGNQVSICLSVIDSFLNKGNKNVVLSAPTGIGKSVLGAVISETLDYFTPEDDRLVSTISMGTNSLATQYAESFSSLDKYNYFQIQGASNYPCEFMKNQPSATSKTADECVKKNLLPEESDRYCLGCEYDRAKKLVNITRNLITNYTYFFIAALASGHLKERKLHIFDEAHTINDWFCTYTEINLSIEILERYIKELGDVNGKCDNEIAGLIMLKNKIANEEVHEGNYVQVLEILQKLYGSISFTLGAQAALLEKIDVVKSSKYAKMARKYESNLGKIRDLFDNEYDHVFDNSVKNSVTIKTIFVNQMIGKLLTTYNLFMSGTITEQYSFDILGLDRSETDFIEVDPVFPAENKPLFFIGKNALNYQSMKDPDVIGELVKKTQMIVKFHAKDKGLILVPSFFLGSQLARAVNNDTKVFEHRSGEKLPELIKRFKEYKASSVLISPSIFEGLDFKDEDSRYQIIVKSPYPSLGDKRIKHIADNYPSVYQEITLVKILQGIGRSVRTPEDFCHTYLLDPSSKKLFDSKLNIWKHHYTVMS